MPATTTRTYRIEGFHCSGCADNLAGALRRLEGVIRVHAEFERALVEVRFDPERISDETIEAQIDRAGFAVADADPPR